MDENAKGGGLSPKSGGPSQCTRGAGVKSGLSAQDGFHGEAPSSLGLGTQGKNQRPMKKPSKSVSDNHGTFTLR